MKLSLRQLPWPAQVLVFIALAVALVFIGESLPAPSPLAARRKELASVRERCSQLKQQLASLQDFERRQAQLRTEVEAGQKQLASLQQMVPEDKDLDGFIRQVQEAAGLSGVALRRLVAKPTVAHEYHNEMPFEVELDGPYYRIETFFEQLSRMPRITNVKDLVLVGVAEAAKYKVTAGTTATATFTVVTFYSHAAQPVPATKP